MSEKKSLLVMDDDPRACAYLADVLNYFGFKVECVESCNSAMRRLKENAYDALLLDMWMADGTGRDLLGWLRDRGRNEPVIMMSVNADYDQWIDLVNRGASDLLAKPVEPSQLKRALQLAVGEMTVSG